MYHWNIADNITKEPHTLIAGATGSGKSTVLNIIICQLLQESPEKIDLKLIDPKYIELAKYSGCPHVSAIAREKAEAVALLSESFVEIKERYKAPNTAQKETYIIIDELAYLSSDKLITGLISDIGRLGRAAGVHLICATQDPSRRTLKAEIMQNFTANLALRCRFKIESRQILGVAGAEALPAHGQGIYQDSTGLTFCSIPYIPEEDIRSFIAEVEEAGKAYKKEAAKQKFAINWRK